MTELYIDKQPVMLPKDFSLEITQENPFFTKGGTRTLEITLSLLDPLNARLYNHYNRINNNTEIASNRRARLIADNNVLMDGIEIILEITEKEVKIQLLSGESELNHVITGGNRKLSDLALGELEYGKNKSSTLFYSFFPIADPDGTIHNKQGVYYANGNLGSYFPMTDIPQPRLYHVAELVVSALGYQLKENILYDDFFALHIINGVKTSKYVRMLPEMTVNDFFSKLEKSFNIVFLLDELNKSVSIVSRKNAINGQIDINEVLDSCTQTIENDERQDYFNANYNYELGSDAYFSFQNLAPEIMEQAEAVEMANFTAIKNLINNTENKLSLQNKIFFSKESKMEYICYREEKDNGEKIYYPKKVNAFKPVLNNPKSKELDFSLEVAPAPITIQDIEIRMGSALYGYLRVQMPQVSVGEYVEDTNFSIQDAIVAPTEKKKNETILMAYYTGGKRIYLNQSLSVTYDMAFVDTTDEYITEEEQYIVKTQNLRLFDDRGLKALYESSLNFDSTRLYTFRFTYNRKIDLNKIFIINNKKFICMELMYTVNPKGFYP
ncbi:MAG: hypothetical protein LBL07_06315, partial [Tannerella sp.]|nr:hypothetical protein [Tannerella sp.]